MRDLEAWLWSEASREEHIVPLLCRVMALCQRAAGPVLATWFGHVRAYFDDQNNEREQRVKDRYRELDWDEPMVAAIGCYLFSGEPLLWNREAFTFGDLLRAARKAATQLAIDDAQAIALMEASPPTTWRSVDERPSAAAEEDGPVEAVISALDLIAARVPPDATYATKLIEIARAVLDDASRVDELHLFMMFRRPADPRFEELNREVYQLCLCLVDDPEHSLRRSQEYVERPSLTPSPRRRQPSNEPWIVLLRAGVSPRAVKTVRTAKTSLAEWWHASTSALDMLLFLAAHGAPRAELFAGLVEASPITPPAAASALARGLALLRAPPSAEATRSAILGGALETLELANAIERETIVLPGLEALEPWRQRFALACFADALATALVIVGSPDKLRGHARLFVSRLVGIEQLVDPQFEWSRKQGLPRGVPAAQPRLAQRIRELSPAPS